MKQLLPKLSAMLAVLLVLTLAIQPVNAHNTNWNHFSVNLEKALKTPNLGLQQSAMRLVIKYGNKLDVKNALSDVVALYMNHQDEQVRDLALLTIYRMDSQKAMELLDERHDIDYNSVLKEKLDKYLSKN